MAEPGPAAAESPPVEPSPSESLPSSNEPLPPVDASIILPTPTELPVEPAAPAAEVSESTGPPLEPAPSPGPEAEEATSPAEPAPAMTPAEPSPMEEKEEEGAESHPPVSETPSPLGSGIPAELVPETEESPSIPETLPAAGPAVTVEANEVSPPAGIPEGAPSEAAPASAGSELTPEPAPSVSESSAETGIPVPEMARPSEPVEEPMTRDSLEPVPEPETPEPLEPVPEPETPEPLEPVPEPETPEPPAMAPPASPGEPGPSSGLAVPLPTESSVVAPEVAPPSQSPTPSEVVPPPLVPEAPAPPEPPVPPPKPPTVAPPPVPSGIELEIGSSPFTSLQPFLGATAAGHRGICLVRESPQRIAAQVGPRPVDVYWLTNLGRGKTLRPSDLPGIFALLERAVRDDHVTALFLEGVEYLVRIHGVEELVGRLSGLNELAKAHDARVWVHLTPDLLRPHDLERITTALRAPPGS